MKRNELEERLVDFSVSIIRLIEEIPATRAGNHLSGQLVRSGTSSALNYGEACSAESPNDFIHKIKVVLKELRETNICLKIIFNTQQFADQSKILSLLKENDELIAIFVRSATTASKNTEKKQLLR